MSKMSELALERQTQKDKLFHDLGELLEGRPIDEVAPILVVAVARVLVLDAGYDTKKSAMNVAKFMHRLTDMVDDMLTGDPEGTVH